MSTALDDLSVDALRDLGRVRKVPGHNDMDRDALLDALDGPVDDALARYLGKSRKELYAIAGEKGIENRMDMQKWELLEALAEKG
jgi:hypothetical protein